MAQGARVSSDWGALAVARTQTARALRRLQARAPSDENDETAPCESRCASQFLTTAEAQLWPQRCDDVRHDDADDDADDGCDQQDDDDHDHGNAETSAEEVEHQRVRGWCG